MAVDNFAGAVDNLPPLSRVGGGAVDTTCRTSENPDLYARTRGVNGQQGGGKNWIKNKKIN
jgi:hypothetical protein